MDFGLMFFSGGASDGADDPYRLLREAVRFADREGLRAVWTPERHFHRFGGLFPNPSVLGAGIATLTERVQIRAGSLISPLHDPIRIAEEWSVVDNLSGGRVGISFGSGWNVDDFVFFPDRYESRREVMFEQIEQVRSLWRGQAATRRNTYGKDVEARIFPRPVQEELPVWVTSSGNPETFRQAGEAGANVLTHLIGQDLETLAGKLETYRRAREASGHDPDGGVVSLMLHTFLGKDPGIVRALVRKPFRDYLASAISLEQMAAKGGGVISGGKKIDPHQIPPRVMEDLLDATFERYYRSASLLGTVESCRETVRAVAEIGVTEIACLVDFMDDEEEVLDALPLLGELTRQVAEDGGGAAEASPAPGAPGR